METELLIEYHHLRLAELMFAELGDSYRWNRGHWEHLNSYTNAWVRVSRHHMLLEAACIIESHNLPVFVQTCEAVLELFAGMTEVTEGEHGTLLTGGLD